MSYNPSASRVVPLSANLPTLGSTGFGPRVYTANDARKNTWSGVNWVPDVYDLGAVPGAWWDNSHDDFSALNSFLTGLPAGALCTCPPAMTSLSAPITLTKPILFFGSGGNVNGSPTPTGTVFNFSNETNGIIYAGPAGSIFQMRNLEVFGSAGSSTVGVTIGGNPGVTGAARGRWDTVTISHFSDTQLLLGGSEVIQFDSLLIGGGVDGIRTSDDFTSALLFNNVVITDTSRYAFNGSNNPFDLTFIGGDSEGNTGKGFHLTNGGHLIMGHRFEATSGVEIELVDTYACSILHNKNFTNGISLSNTSDCKSNMIGGNYAGLGTSAAITTASGVSSANYITAINPSFSITDAGGALEQVQYLP